MQKPPKINPNRVKYFPIQQYWRSLKPIFESEAATGIWVMNMADFEEQRSVERGYKNMFPKNRCRLILNSPSEYDSCDWRFNRGKRGRAPAYFNYACHSACHWVADLALFVASKHSPHIQWRIITSQKHSTVWNGCKTRPVLFDINFSAIGISPSEAWILATKDGEVLEPGCVLRESVYDDDFQNWFYDVLQTLTNPDHKVTTPSIHAQGHSCCKDNTQPCP